MDYGKRGRDGIALGRYVIMPDHIHLFVCGSDDFNLGIWVRGLKRVVAAAVTGGREGDVERKDSAAVTAAARSQSNSGVCTFQSGSVDSSIILSETARAIRRNGITSMRIRFELDWFDWR